MLLFLDVISPLPEILLIEENKIICRRKITKNESEKLSDKIIEFFVEIDNSLNLTDKLSKIAITIGPGSYTSLRVGAAFLSGLKISRELLFCPISIMEVFEFQLNNNDLNKTGIYINSANDQNFFCTIDRYKNIIYNKVEEKNYNIPKNINKIYYNEKKLSLNEPDILQHKFFFSDMIFKNYQKLKFSKNEIIRPIYISNNKILN